METSTIYKTKKVNSINTITCEIEETFMNNFSVLVFDLVIIYDNTKQYYQRVTNDINSEMS